MFLSVLASPYSLPVDQEEHHPQVNNHSSYRFKAVTAPKKGMNNEQLNLYKQRYRNTASSSTLRRAFASEVGIRCGESVSRLEYV